ncbi:DUF488 domain-containing protein, partial [Candidatus Fermentibacteria bacterium]|nr:DUF488 domain-containing protein [Candidatus Fermentibacteria bacterium]
MQRTPDERPGKVYTIGHSTLALQDLCAILRDHGISVVADVRRFPASRRNPQYARETLSSVLGDAGIGYVWLGDDLGGFRADGYETYMTTDGFGRGISALETIAGESPTAVLCAERDPAACHRRFIADELTRRGWEVIHI